MIFLELIHKYKDIYYLDHIDFYIKSKNIAIIPIPFFNRFLMNNALKKIIKNANEFDINEINKKDQPMRWSFYCLDSEFKGCKQLNKIYTNLPIYYYNR